MRNTANAARARRGAILRGAPQLSEPLNGHPIDPRKQIMAELCRTIGATIRGQVIASPAAPALPSLSPRMRQTLQRLLVGDSEKQIARHMGLSQHTVHVYVKALYKGFDVRSRGELLARFVRQPSLQSPSSRPESSAGVPSL